MIKFSKIKFKDKIFFSAEVELFQDEKILCNKPILSVRFWNDKNEVILNVGDYDDMDISMIYCTNNYKESGKIFHELVNFLNDIEGQLINPFILFNEDFYPDLGVKKVLSDLY